MATINFKKSRHGGKSVLKTICKAAKLAAED